MRWAILAAGLAVAASAQAAAPDHYRIQTGGQLAQVCGTPSTADDYPTAIALCHGFLAGAYAYYLSATPRPERYVCSPDPAPTRSKVAEGYVAWARSHPQAMQDTAVDALFRYAAETYPCKR